MPLLAYAPYGGAHDPIEVVVVTLRDFEGAAPASRLNCPDQGVQRYGHGR